MSASSKKKLRKEQKIAALTKKQEQARKEAKTLKKYTVTFTVAMILVVAIVIGIVLSNPINGMINRKTTAVTINDHTLKIADLSYFYVDGITEYYNELYNQYYSMYGQYASYFIPFSLYSPMNEQEFNGVAEDDKKFDTWADFFMDKAIEDAKTVYTLYDMAMKDNHELTETEEKALKDYKKLLSSYASQSGYSSSSSFLRVTYGNGCNAENYYKYFEASTYASSYFAAYKDSLEYKYEDYRAYEEGKFDEYSSFDYYYYQISMDSYKGEGKKNETTGKVEYTDEELKKALEDAKKDAEKLIETAPKNLEAFNLAIGKLEVNKDNKKAAATEHKAYPYSYVPETIREWVINKDRQEGDMEMIAIEKEIKDDDGKVTGKETTGYYVVLYSGREDYLDKMVSVRHILVKFEGGTKDKDTGETVYSEAEKKKAKEEAEKIYKEWQDGKKDEDSFSALANKNSDDNNGKVTNGGLYENIYTGQMVETFNDWCFDKDRNPGDHDIIETEYGYHIMYFVKTQDLSYRDYNIEQDLISEACEKFLDDANKSAKYTEGDLSRMEWDIIVSG